MRGGFVLIALSFVYNLLFAQQPYVLPQVSPKSPNVASFEKYRNIPVSLSTGIPNINIPLTSLSIDGLTIPITLNYHNNGLKVEEIPSMMGLGWDLSFGGLISYNQHGINDFNTSANGMQTAAARSSLEDYRNGTDDEATAYRYLESVLNEQVDNDYDTYNLNLLGQSGMFYFDGTGNAVIAPKSDLKIYKLDPGIKVIDNDGNQFFFQAAEGASSYEASTVYISPTFADVSAWHLSKIITKNNREIRFKYKFYQIQYAKTKQFLTYFPFGSGNCGSNSNDYASILITLGCLLPDVIEFDQGYLKFNLSSSPRQDLLQNPTRSSVPSLVGFYVANNQGQKISEFEFTQGYFGSNARLKLASVQEKANSQTGRKWQFSYYGEDGYFPAYNDNGQDHWGYYNGANNYSLIPEANYRRDVIGNWTDLLHGNYANRRSNFNYAKNGMLQTIQYPTGGTTTFEYEPNQIRVDNISQVLGNPFLKWTSALPTKTVYLASGNTNSTGSTGGSFTITEPTVCYMQSYFQQDYPSYLGSASITFTGPKAGLDELSRIENMNLNNYYNQGFGEIELEPGTYTWSLNQGYNYDQGYYLQATLEISTQVLDSSGVLPPFQLPGGRISTIISHDNVANIRSSSKKFIYNDNIGAVVWRNIPYYATKKDINLVNGPSCFPCSQEYKITDESVRPFVGSNIEYKYVTEFEEIDGSGGKTEYTFLTTTDEGGNLYNKPYVAPVNTFWRGGNILSEKNYKYENGSYKIIKQTDNGFYIGVKEKYVNGIKVDYTEWSSNSGAGCRTHIVAMPTLFTERFYQNGTTTKDFSNNTITKTMGSSATSANHTQPIMIEKFDSKGQSVKEKTIYSFDYDVSNVSSPEAIAIRLLVNNNILVPMEKIQIKTIGGADYVIGSTLYTYKTGSTVIDRIYSLNVTSPVLASSFVPSSIDRSGTFIKDSRYELRIIESKYDQFNNIVEQQKSSDVISAYLWDYNNYYPIAEIVNADIESVAYTSFEADGNGNWNINSPVRNSQGVTGTRSYQLSNGPIQKLNLNSTTEYIVSYWSNSGAYGVNGTIGNTVQGKTVNLNGVTWTYYQHKVLGVVSVTVSGNGAIDELRLYPANAQMVTYAYQPLIGITTHCDAGNNIVYYEYDEFSRLLRIRDVDRNILKQFEYKYQIN